MMVNICLNDVYMIIIKFEVLFFDCFIYDIIKLRLGTNLNAIYMILLKGELLYA